MRREVLRLIASQIFVHAVMAGVRMAAPLLALREGFSAAAVGLLLSLFALSQVFLALPVGKFSDRRGLKLPVRIAATGSCLGALLAAIFPVFPVLCLAAILAGAGAGTLAICTQRHVGKISRDAAEMRQSFGFLAVGPAISNFIGPFFAGVMIDVAGFRAAFAMLAVLPLLSLIWIAPVKDLPPQEFDADAPKARAWDLLAEPVFRRVLLVNWLLSACWDIHTFIVPILGFERHLSASVIGTILGGFAIAAAAIRIVMPIVAAKAKEHVVLTSAMVITTIMFCVYPFMTSAYGMAFCSVVLGLALGSVQPMIMSTLHHVTPPARHGEALGLRLMIINASSVTIPILFGFAGAVVGVSAVFWASGAAVFAGTRTAWSLDYKE